MPEFDDLALLAALQKGSLEAYELLFKRYYRLLCLQAHFMLNDRCRSEDLVQEVFIKLWSKKKFRKIEQSLKAYLYSAVRNQCLNEIRKDKQIQKNKAIYEEYRIKKIEPQWLEQKELSAQIHHVLQAFPPQRRRAFTLIYIENKRYQEAAEEMGVSINSVKTHLKLARKVLREELEIFR